MSSPLIQHLTDELSYPLLNADNFDAFIEQAPYSVLFFTEQPKRFPESNDVAVILPELVKQFPQLSPAVVSTDCEKSLQGRYAFNVWPALVFLKDGEFLGTITKVQDWNVYLAEIGSILASDPKPNPGATAAMTTIPALSAD